MRCERFEIAIEPPEEYYNEDAGDKTEEETSNGGSDYFYEGSGSLPPVNLQSDLWWTGFTMK